MGDRRMIPQEEVKKFKILVGMFHEEMKSKSTTDLVIWLECKLELDKKRNKEIRKYTQETQKTKIDLFKKQNPDWKII